MALATIDDLKELLSINHGDSDDLLTRLVAAASQWFEGQVGRTLAATDYVEVKDGSGGRAIVPSHYPVLSVTSVTVNGEPVDESTGYGVAGWYQNGDVIRLRDAFVPEGSGNVEVGYRAGYETIPDDVQAAVIEVAAVMFRERDRIGQQSKNFGGETVTYYYAPPARVVSTVEAYRRVM